MRIVRGIIGLFGELLITVGAFLLLFVGWQLIWTDVVADADGEQVINTMESQFADPEAEWVLPAKVKLGDAYAIIRIPRFGAKYAKPLYEGTTRDVLMRGIGHYSKTQQIGEVGNFAMAGHRTTYGKPFNQVDKLKDGDVILVETKKTYYVYRVTSHQIVRPTQVSVLLPVPDEPGVEAETATLTMTSCHPEFSSRERFVVHAELDQTYPHDPGVPTEVLKVVD